jgi:hypothetical protein
VSTKRQDAEARARASRIRSAHPPTLLGREAVMGYGVQPGVHRRAALEEEPLSFGFILIWIVIVSGVVTQYSHYQ